MNDLHFIFLLLLKAKLLHLIVMLSESAAHCCYCKSCEWPGLPFRKNI